MLTQKRALGKYATPIKTVDYMVDKVLEHIADINHPVILDPAVGDGVFVDRLIHKGIDPSFIHAFDIDPEVVEKNRHRLPLITIQDFLLADASQYDVIIGNPPYKSKRQSSYIKANRLRLEKQFAEIGVQNLYAMFIYQAFQQLKEGGLLCFIVQDSFLTNVYYTKFRRFLLDNSLIKEILLAPRDLFHHTDADVRTAILTLEKCTGKENEDMRRNNVMRLVDRLQDEDEYDHPPDNKVQLCRQNYFCQMEHYNFFVNVPLSVIHTTLETPLKLGDVTEGGTGISTGHDARFLRKADDIPENEQGNWVPFYKNGGKKDAWYYETPYRIHKDWQTPSTIYRDFMARNASCYFREGITCSSMGIEFSAAYLPEGCLFGVNANLFTRNRDDLFYILAFLNSHLAKYILRAVFNRTNMITAGYVKRLPYIEPDRVIKQEVVRISKYLVEQRMKDREFPYARYQKKIDRLFYEIYQIPEEDRPVIDVFCEGMFERL
ncbi:MAG: N-6 DNA methylase [Bacillaceae bacterium]|nr:N-6 DNA methylase [Bacillaceae bacterium]